MLPVAPKRKLRPLALGYVPGFVQAVQSTDCFPTLLLPVCWWATSVFAKSTGALKSGHSTPNVIAKLDLLTKLGWIACCCISCCPPGS